MNKLPNKGNLPKEGYPNPTVDFSFVLASSVRDMKDSLSMLLITLAAMMEKSPPADAEQAKFFSTLEYEAARINGELVQLLSLYQMDEQSLGMHIDEHYVIDVIDEQVARNDTLFNIRKLNIRVECDANLVWYFDNEMIGGVLNNLLVNCARYGQNQLLVSACIENDFLCISVADDGTGYPESMLEDPSPQVGASFGSSNTRLGLLFARKVLALHRSKKGQGYLVLANNSLLGGGVIKLYLP